MARSPEDRAAREAAWPGSPSDLAAPAGTEPDGAGPRALLAELRPPEARRAHPPQLLRRLPQMGRAEPARGEASGSVPSGDEITIRQLAGMHSGLYNYLADLYSGAIPSQPDKQWSVSELLGISFSHPLLFQPGPSSTTRTRTRFCSGA
jgi:hypothetical protein